MEWTRIVAERQIQEAIDAGEFDNLPGKGKPLDLDEDMHLPPHQRIVVRLLKNARALPDWLQAEKDIERETEAAKTLRQRGLTSLAHARTDDRRGRIAARLRADYRERMDTVNTLILKYNFIAPAGYQRALIPFRIREEMERLEAEIAAR